MQTKSKSVIETLVAIDGQRIPASRLRGLKPSTVRFCFDQGLIKDYVGFGVLLSPAGVAVVRAQRPDWQSVARADAQVEADARRMCEAAGLDPDRIASGTGMPHWKFGFEAKARAALSPTPEASK